MSSCKAFVIERRQRQMFSQAMVNLRGFSNVIYKAHLEAKGVSRTVVDEEAGEEMESDRVAETRALMESL